MKLTIVTINRNNAAGLARTLESTFGAQPGFDDWEQIVVDGASSDGSYAVLDKWKDHPRLGWHVSEPDTGIYNAMNKGASHARGDYLLFLNSGDVLLENALSDVFSRPLEADLVISNMYICRKGVDSHYFAILPDRMDSVFFLFETLPHQGTLISRKLHMQLGGYDECLRFAADLKFFFRCFTEGKPSVSWLAEPFSRFFNDGVSYRTENRKTIQKEWREILLPVFGEDIARRAGYKLEERPWIRDEVAVRASQDRDLAKYLRLLTNCANCCWSFPPIRVVARTVLRSLSWMARASGLRRQNTIAPIRRIPQQRPESSSDHP